MDKVFKKNRLKILKNHSHTVNCIIVYKEFLISGSDDQRILIWNTDGDCIRRLENHDSGIHSLLLFRYYVISGDSNGNIFYWENILEGQIKYKLKAHENRVNCLIEFNNNLISGSFDSSIKIWDQEGICIKVLTNHTGWITSLYPLKDDYFFSASLDSKIMKWDINHGLIKEIEIDTPSFSLILYNDFLISANNGGLGDSINLYDLELNFVDKIKSDTFIYGFIIFKGYLCSGGYDSKISIWDIQKRKCQIALGVCRNSVTSLISWNGNLTFTSSGKNIKVFKKKAK